MTKKLKSVRAKALAQVFGAFPEGIINAAVSKGVEIWNLERLDSNTLRFELRENDIASIRELAKRCSLELKVTCLRDESRRMLKKRFILLPLLGIMGLLTIASSLFVWQIDIYGLGSVSRGEVMRSLEESGLRPGTFWPGLKADDIRSRLMLEMPEIAWMTVNVSGSRAKVLVNERVDKPEIYNEANPADLVAGKTGLVRRVSVLSGDAGNVIIWADTHAEAGEDYTYSVLPRHHLLYENGIMLTGDESAAVHYRPGGLFNRLFA